MRLLDFFILTRCIHEAVDIHSSEFPFAPKERQQITARIARRSHDETSAVKFNIDAII